MQLVQLHDAVSLEGSNRALILHLGVFWSMNINSKYEDILTNLINRPSNGLWKTHMVTDELKVNLVEFDTTNFNIISKRLQITTETLAISSDNQATREIPIFFFVNVWHDVVAEDNSEYEELKYVFDTNFIYRTHTRRYKMLIMTNTTTPDIKCLPVGMNTREDRWSIWPETEPTQEVLNVLAAKKEIIDHINKD